jgi:integrase
LKNRGKEAGIKSFSSHDLRRTFISNMLPLTDLVTVSAWVGHSKPDVTLSYDRRNETRKIDAAGLLSIPFTPRDDEL